MVTLITCTVFVCVSMCHRVLSPSVVSDSVRPQDCSPPGFSVHGILQARIWEWVAMSLYVHICETEGRYEQHNVGKCLYGEQMDLGKRVEPRKPSSCSCVPWHAPPKTLEQILSDCTHSRPSYPDEVSMKQTSLPNENLNF